MNTKTQQHSVYERCRELIVSGELAGGERVTENNLADKLGVKRGPVRESLIRLEAEGFIRKASSFGYFVEDYSEEDPRDVIMIRQSLESLASAQAAQQATREDIVRLTLIFEEQERGVKEGVSDESWSRLDKEFHRRIVNASGSKILRKIYSLINLPVLPGNTPVTKAKKAKTVEEHRAILSAIKAGDPEKAGVLAKRHLDKKQQGVNIQ